MLPPLLAVALFAVALALVVCMVVHSCWRGAAFSCVGPCLVTLPSMGVRMTALADGC